MEVRAWVGGDGVGAWSPSHREGRGWRRTGRQRERRLKPGATAGAGVGAGGRMVKRFILTPAGLTSWFWGRRPGGRGGRGQATPLHRTGSPTSSDRGAGAGVVKPRPYIGLDHQRVQTGGRGGRGHRTGGTAQRCVPTFADFDVVLFGSDGGGRSRREGAAGG